MKLTSVFEGTQMLMSFTKLYKRPDKIFGIAGNVNSYVET